jgi:putative transposase
MGNHFHLLVRIKSAEIITQNILQIPEIKRVLSHCHFLALPEEDRDFHSVIERQFTRLFTSFAMIFNHAQQRRGNLFYRPFKRVEVGDENHLIWLVYYIHSNPKKHGILKGFQQYRWSSYATFLSDSTTNLMRTEVLEWFCGLERFISFHTEENDLPENSMYLAIDQ